jgi:hypothetical protein
MSTTHLADTDLSALFGIDLDMGDGVAPASAEYFDRKCAKCNGSGRYTKRLACFACNGTGMVPGAAVRMVDFADAHPEVAKWIETNKDTNSFAASMAASIGQYGRLTPNQLAACERIAKAPPPAAAPQVDTDRLMAAFDKARANGLKRPKMRFEVFEASLAPSTGRNPGAVYLKAGETYLGKIDSSGKFFASRDASPEQRAAIVKTMADPLAAAVTYGRRTGNCAICGIELTNKESINRGIGPICADKFGF